MYLHNKLASKAIQNKPLRLVMQWVSSWPFLVTAVKEQVLHETKQNICLHVQVTEIIQWKLYPVRKIG